MHWRTSKYRPTTPEQQPSSISVLLTCSVLLVRLSGSPVWAAVRSIVQEVCSGYLPVSISLIGQAVELKATA